MTVNQAIDELQRLRDAGHGEAVLRSYSELADELYPPVGFILRSYENNPGHFPERYGTWVEVA